MPAKFLTYPVCGTYSFSVALYSSNCYKNLYGYSYWRVVLFCANVFGNSFLLIFRPVTRCSEHATSILILQIFKNMLAPKALTKQPRGHPRNRATVIYDVIPKNLATPARPGNLFKNIYFGIYKESGSEYFLASKACLKTSNVLGRILIHTYIHAHKHSYSPTQEPTYTHSQTYTYAHTHSHIHSFTYTYVRTYVHPLTRIYLQTYAYTNIHTHSYIHTRPHSHAYSRRHTHTQIIKHINIFTHTRTHMYTLADVHIHTYYTHIHTYTYTLTHIHTYIYTFAHTHTQIIKHLNTFTHTRTHIYTLSGVHIHILYTHIYIHINLHTCTLSHTHSHAYTCRHTHTRILYTYTHLQINSFAHTLTCIHWRHKNTHIIILKDTYTHRNIYSLHILFSPVSDTFFFLWNLVLDFIRDLIHFKSV